MKPNKLQPSFKPSHLFCVVYYCVFRVSLKSMLDFFKLRCIIRIKQLVLKLDLHIFKRFPPFCGLDVGLNRGPPQLLIFSHLLVAVIFLLSLALFLEG